MLKLRLYRCGAAARKAADGTPYMRIAGQYYAIHGATPRTFVRQRLMVIYSPTGRIVKSIDLSSLAMRRRARELRLELVGRLLRKKGGTTRQEVIKRTGWRAVSMQAAAKAAGLALKTKGTNPIRYFGARR